jgi:hypothetical protein
VRKTRQTSSDSARRSPEPMNRRARKKSLATASAGRAAVSRIAASSSIAAAIPPVGVSAGQSCR